MKLWLLRNKFGDGNYDPWNPWYDKTFGFVVRAENEIQARAFAATECGDEGCNAWLSEVFSSCEELGPEGMPEVLIRDHRSA